MELNRIYQGDSRELIKQIDSESISIVCTSPPYNKSLTTQEESRILYKDNMDEGEYRDMLNCIFTECYRVLKPNGQMFMI